MAINDDQVFKAANGKTLVVGGSTPHPFCASRRQRAATSLPRLAGCDLPRVPPPSCPAQLSASVSALQAQYTEGQLALQGGASEAAIVTPDITVGPGGLAGEDLV
jgi:hypothetical protein